MTGTDCHTGLCFYGTPKKSDITAKKSTIILYSVDTKTVAHCVLCIMQGSNNTPLSIILIVTFCAVIFAQTHYSFPVLQFPVLGVRVPVREIGNYSTRTLDTFCLKGPLIYRSMMRRSALSSSLEHSNQTSSSFSVPSKKYSDTIPCPPIFIYLVATLSNPTQQPTTHIPQQPHTTHFV